MANRIPRVQAREQDPAARSRNFEEVSYGFNEEEALLEASRCLHCKKPMCMTGCPVHVHIPDFIAHLVEGDIEAAADAIAQDSSLPAVCGRVCKHESQCEGKCILGVKGEPVSIGNLERYVADHQAIKPVEDVRASLPPFNGHKVAIIGSGPAGLACATDLAKMGYKVHIFEALHKAGGILAYGIPEFRLPKETVLQKELDKVTALGVTIETDVIVGLTVTIGQLFDEEGYDAVFLGTGACKPRFMGIPGENFNGVCSANEFLTRVNLMQGFRDDYLTPVHMGKKAFIVGAGNVAMDAARTALRLGAEVTIVYRRSEQEIPACMEEVRQAKEEGVHLDILTNPVEIYGDENGWVRGMRCIRMELGEPDADGRRKPVAIPGSEFEVECDTVIMSLGTVASHFIVNSTPGLNCGRNGGYIVDESGATSRPGIFSGGDAVTGPATVVQAMGAGRRAARAIDEYIRNKA